jgi:hypothetical protein
MLMIPGPSGLGAALRQAPTWRTELQPDIGQMPYGFLDKRMQKFSRSLQQIGID